MKPNKYIKKYENETDRPLRRSKVDREINGEEIINKCIGFCNPPRLFRAISKYNKICPQCKAQEKWRDY